MNWTVILDNLKTVPGAIVSSATVITILWKWKGKALYEHYKKNREAWRVLMMEVQKTSNDNTEKLIGRIGNIETDVSTIKMQLYPNGGNSMFDTVTNTSDFLEMLMKDRSFWKSDQDGRVIFVSASLLDILECDQTQMKGNSWIGLVLAIDRTRVLDSWQQSVKNASMFKEQFSFVTCIDQVIKVQASSRHKKDKYQNLISSLVEFTVLS